MGLKESGLRGSLRNVSVGIDAIPDNVVLQYFATNVSGGDATWLDDNGVANMSLTQGETSTTLSDGADALGFDGNSDEGLITLPESLEGDGLKSFAIEFSGALNHDRTESITGHVNDNDGQILQIRFNFDEDFNEDPGNIYLRLDDKDGNRLQFAPSSNPNLNDGQRHDVSLVINDSDENDVGIIIDGTNVSLSFRDQEGPSNFGPWESDMPISRDDFGVSNLEWDLGAMRFWDSGIGQQSIGDFE